MKKSFNKVMACSLLILASACGAPNGVEVAESSLASSSTCNPPNPPGTYDAFPGTGSFPSGPAKDSLAWPGENFERYADREIVECSNQQKLSHLDVTSACLESRKVSAYGRGFTDDDVFRVLAVGLSGGKRIKWTNQVNAYRANIKRFHQADCPTCGVHLFARYRTENDLYVASLRQDGKVTIKKKQCGQYTTLVEASYGVPRVDTWYNLQFAAIGTQLTFSINGQKVLQTTDGTFSWGTSGIRTDKVDVYFDDWNVTAP